MILTKNKEYIKFYVNMLSVSNILPVIFIPVLCDLGFPEFLLFNSRLNYVIFCSDHSH